VFCVHQPAQGNEAERLNAVGHDGVDYAKGHLGRLPVVLAARFGRTWSLYDTFPVPEGRSATVTAIGVVAFFVLVPLAVYGLVLLRRRQVPVWILVAPFVTVTLTTLLAYGALRFRQSAELPLAVLAAVAIDWLFNARRTA
jgi:hypothetical protein